MLKIGERDDSGASPPGADDGRDAWEEGSERPGRRGVWAHDRGQSEEGGQHAEESGKPGEDQPTWTDFLCEGSDDLVQLRRILRALR